MQCAWSEIPPFQLMSPYAKPQRAIVELVKQTNDFVPTISKLMISVVVHVPGFASGILGITDRELSRPGSETKVLFSGKGYYARHSWHFWVCPLGDSWHNVLLVGAHIVYSTFHAPCQPLSQPIIKVGSMAVYVPQPPWHRMLQEKVSIAHYTI